MIPSGYRSPQPTPANGSSAIGHCSSGTFDNGALSCTISIVLASVITAIVTAILATVIFKLVLADVYKRLLKYTPEGAEKDTSRGEKEEQEYNEVDVSERGGAKKGTLAGKVEEQVYDEVDVSEERGVAVSDPTYMEVGEGGFELE